MKRILLVDDSPQLQVMVEAAMAATVELRKAATISEAELYLGQERFDLMLLDVGLPDGDGMRFLSRVREDRKLSELVVILLTGRGATTDKVNAFSLGADDYVVKPFDPLELRARVDARLRRAEERAGGVSKLERGALRIDFLKQKAFVQETDTLREIELTPAEFKLLAFLVRNEDMALTRESILESVWGEVSEVFDRAIDKHVCILRRKLGASAPYVCTVRGIGYRFSVTNPAGDATEE